MQASNIRELLPASDHDRLARQSRMVSPQLPNHHAPQELTMVSLELLELSMMSKELVDDQWRARCGTGQSHRRQRTRAPSPGRGDPPVRTRASAHNASRSTWEVQRRPGRPRVDGFVALARA